MPAVLDFLTWRGSRVNKTLAVLLLGTLAACGGTSAKPSGLTSASPTAIATTLAPKATAATTHKPSPSPKPRITTASPKPSPKPAATTASPKPRATATKSPVPTAKVYANCTAMHVDYKGGVALPGAVNNGGTTHYKPYVSTALYDANKGKDRDHDGIACEA
jgi:hypothetical protein